MTRMEQELVGWGGETAFIAVRPTVSKRPATGAQQQSRGGSPPKLSDCTQDIASKRPATEARWRVLQKGTDGTRIKCAAATIPLPHCDNVVLSQSVGLSRLCSSAKMQHLGKNADFCSSEFWQLRETALTAATGMTRMEQVLEGWASETAARWMTRTDEWVTRMEGGMDDSDR